MNQLTVVGLSGWCCVEAPVPGGQPSVMLQLELHGGEKVALLVRETELGALVNTFGHAWIEFAGLRMGRPSPGRWAKVVKEGNPILVIPPGQPSNGAGGTEQAGGHS
jgi:hypothetical protein